MHGRFQQLVAQIETSKGTQTIFWVEYCISRPHVKNSPGSHKFLKIFVWTTIDIFGIFLKQFGENI